MLPPLRLSRSPASCREKSKREEEEKAQERAKKPDHHQHGGTEHRDRERTEMECYVRERDGLRQHMLYNSSSS